MEEYTHVQLTIADMHYIAEESARRTAEEILDRIGPKLDVINRKLNELEEQALMIPRDMPATEPNPFYHPVDNRYTPV